MKTSLTPPPITPDWTPSRNREGNKRYFSELPSGGVYSDLHRYFVQDDLEYEANCKFFESAPKMAEALEMCIMDLENALERIFGTKEASCEGLLQARAALLAAGYTETTADH